MIDDDLLEDLEDDADGFGCHFPKECCMPGVHLRSECHTAEMLDEIQNETLDGDRQ